MDGWDDSAVESRPLEGKRVAFIGKLGGVTRKEAQQLVRAQGGLPIERPRPDVDLIVIGADELPLADPEELLDDATRQAVAEGRLEIISETQLWQQLGLVESQQHVRRLYTPAMLADLLGVSVATIRRWHRRGLIVPAREVHRLPYFDFQEVATARRLAQLLAAGASARAIERKLAELSRFVPEIERPLAQLSVIVEGRELLLRRGEGLIEPGGQLRIDFDALERKEEEEGPARSSGLESTEREGADGEYDATLSVDGLSVDGLSREALSLDALRSRDARRHSAHPADTPDRMVWQAAELEDEGALEEAVDMYRAALACGGPRPEICFQLAELLYRLGDVAAARERYYMAIELDEDYVEARANLGCVLAETGQVELAVAAFEGALSLHHDYPDVHYHLARTLDELGQVEQAESHWRTFLELAPDSPWADEAWQRLDDDELEEDRGQRGRGRDERQLRDLTATWQSLAEEAERLWEIAANDPEGPGHSDI